MLIKQLLEETNARISIDNKWLYWDDAFQEWVVLERRPYAKKNDTLYRGTGLSIAIDIINKGS